METPPKAGKGGVPGCNHRRGGRECQPMPTTIGWEGRSKTKMTSFQKNHQPYIKSLHQWELYVIEIYLLYI